MHLIENTSSQSNTLRYVGPFRENTSAAEPLTVIAEPNIPYIIAPVEIGEPEEFGFSIAVKGVPVEEEVGAEE